MIFSIQERDRAVRSVDLVCPRCGLDRAGAVITPTRWACVAGLPLVRLGEHDPVVRCDECGHRSDLGALDVPTSDQLAELLVDAWVAALVRALRLDGVPPSAARLADAERTLADAGFDFDGLEVAVTALPDDVARRRIRRLGPELTQFGKQGFLHRIAAVAMNDGVLGDDARAVLMEIGRDLGMALPHVHGVVAVAEMDAAA